MDSLPQGFLALARHIGTGSCPWWKTMFSQLRHMTSRLRAWIKKARA